MAGSDFDEGVSPIVGTLLMVAITVVVAATVWFSVSAIEKKTEHAPAISFYKDPGGPSLIVVQVEEGVDWGEFEFEGSCAPTITLNGGSSPTAGVDVEPGDTLTCQPGQDLIIIASRPNQQVYSTTFA